MKNFKGGTVSEGYYGQKNKTQQVCRREKMHIYKPPSLRGFRYLRNLFSIVLKIKTQISFIYAGFGRSLSSSSLVSSFLLRPESLYLCGFWGFLFWMESFVLKLFSIFENKIVFNQFSNTALTMEIFCSLDFLFI